MASAWHIEVGPETQKEATAEQQQDEAATIHIIFIVVSSGNIYHFSAFGIAFGGQVICGSGTTLLGNPETNTASLFSTAVGWFRSGAIGCWFATA